MRNNAPFEGYFVKNVMKNNRPLMGYFGVYADSFDYILRLKMTLEDAEELCRKLNRGEISEPAGPGRLSENRYAVVKIETPVTTYPAIWDAVEEIFGGPAPTKSVICSR